MAVILFNDSELMAGLSRK